MLQVVARKTNRTSYVLGEITAREAELASIDDPTFDRKGLYLMEVDNEAPRESARVVAKFASEEAAVSLATFFRSMGLLER